MQSNNENEKLLWMVLCHSSFLNFFSKSWIFAILSGTSLNQAIMTLCILTSIVLVWVSHFQCIMLVVTGWQLVAYFNHILLNNDTVYRIWLFLLLLLDVIYRILLISSITRSNGTRCNCSNVWRAELCPYYLYTHYYLCIKLCNHKDTGTHDYACSCWAKISDITVSWAHPLWTVHCTACQHQLSTMSQLSRQSKLCIHLHRFRGCVGDESIPWYLW